MSPDPFDFARVRLAAIQACIQSGTKINQNDLRRSRELRSSYLTAAIGWSAKVTALTITFRAWSVPKTVAQRQTLYKIFTPYSVPASIAHEATRMRYTTGDCGLGLIE